MCFLRRLGYPGIKAELIGTIYCTMVLSIRWYRCGVERTSIQTAIHPNELVGNCKYIVYATNDDHRMDADQIGSLIRKVMVPSAII